MGSDVMGCPAKESGLGDCSFSRHGVWCERHYGCFKRGMVTKKGKIRRTYQKILPHRNSYNECTGKHLGGCSLYKNGRFCRTHWSQFYSGIIDLNGHKIRDRKKRSSKYGNCILSGKGECSTYNHGRFCRKHRSQFNTGIIDENGNRLREPKTKGNIKIYVDCLAVNAGTGSCSKHHHGRFCSKHYDQFILGIIDIQGNKRRGFKYNGSGHIKNQTCRVGNNCGGKVIGSFCRKHWNQLHLGIIDREGNRKRIMATEIKCGVPGCNNRGGFKSGLCRFHYERIVLYEKFSEFPSLNPVLPSTMPVQDVPWYEAD